MSSTSSYLCYYSYFEYETASSKGLTLPRASTKSRLAPRSLHGSAEILNLSPISTHLGRRFHLTSDSGLPRHGVRKARKVQQTQSEFGGRRLLVELPRAFG